WQRRRAKRGSDERSATRTQSDPAGCEPALTSTCLTFVLDGTGLTADTSRRLGGSVMRAPSRRPKLPKVTFYPVPVAGGGNWRLLVHCPGSPLSYISGFNTKTEAEAWASGPKGNAWIRANYQAKEQATASERPGGL